MAGGLYPLGDVLKTDVFKLARLYNSDFELIPKTIISRPPTAELRKNQRDADSLPPYTDLDKSIVRVVEEKKSANNKVDQFLIKALVNSEFKRWQAAPILKVRKISFGRGRRMPIANKALN
jgi:NAD+ synthase (glutamine-hydrolysing)